MKSTYMLAGSLAAGLAIGSVHTYAAGPMLGSATVSSPSTDIVMIADAFPAFDARASCRGGDVAAMIPGRNLDSCVRSEEAARDQLKQIWSEFAATAKTKCLGAVKIGGLPSYVELITCLEMDRDVTRIRSTSPETTGAAVPGGSISKMR